MSALPVTDRTRVRRLSKRADYELATIHAILDEALLCHVGFVVDGAPVVIPTIHWRDGEQLYVHGSTASRMLRSLRDGVDACVTVTLLDGLVLARSAFHHSMNYRSVVVFGRARVVEGEEKLRALDSLGGEATSYGASGDSHGEGLANQRCRPCRPQCDHGGTMPFMRP